MGSRPTGRALRSTAARPVQVIAGMGRQLQSVQDSIRVATKEARAEPWTRGRALRVAFVGAQTKVVAHGLGRKPDGVVPRKHFSGEAMQVGVTGLTSRLVTLTSSATGTVEFWVY